MATQSRSSSSSRPRSGTVPHGSGALPLIECPYHPGRPVVLLTARTEKNRGRKFYRCMDGYKSPSACAFFRWENEYEQYLIDGGFWRKKVDLWKKEVLVALCLLRHFVNWSKT